MKFQGHPASHGVKSLYEILHQLPVFFCPVVAQEALNNCLEDVPGCSLSFAQVVRELGGLEGLLSEAQQKFHL